MGWSIGYDNRWKRDIGYGVTAKCDHPDCDEDIDRGLAHVCCGSKPYGGEDGCGLYFCAKHQTPLGKCERCQNGEGPFDPKPDTDLWMKHKLYHESWAEWRAKQGITRPDGECPYLQDTCGGICE